MKPSILEILSLVAKILGGIAAFSPFLVLIRERFGFFTWPLIKLRTKRLIAKIRDSRFQPDLVIGVGRSGAILGGILAGNLGVVPIAIVDRKYEVIDGKRKTTPLVFISPDHIRSKKILIVDAAPHTGETLREIRDVIVAMEPDKIRTAALIVTPYLLVKIDYWVTKAEKVRKMPWRFSREWREDFSLAPAGTPDSQ